MPLKSRYPGVKPFDTNDQPIFFGRSVDVNKLYDMIGIEKTVLLYSKSGLGKTSLINAGLIPLLIKKENYNYFTVRFGAYSENNTISPKEKVIDLLKKNSGDSPILKINQLQENTICFWFKAIQFPEPEKTNVLIFDQFEELFTYPEDQITELKKELNELIYLKASPSFRKNILQLKSQNPKIFSDEQFNILSSAVNIHLIFAIRSDFLSYLNRLSDYLPTLQLTFYELEPLNKEDAVKAITKPAHSPGDFASPIFDFTPKAVETIINALSDDGKQAIETFQLQIVCQYAENLILKDKTKKVIFPEDLGDIKDIHQSFYNNLINGIPLENEKERRELCILLEEEFIYEPEKRRKQVIEGIVLKKISKKVLSILVETHLIRREPYQNTFTYELSHDTLVEPILKSYHLRKNKEEQEKAEQERREQVRLLNEKNLRQRKRILTFAIVAIISIGCAIFGFINWKIAEDATKKVQEKSDLLKIQSYEKYLTEGKINSKDSKYPEAIVNYQAAKDFTEDRLKINNIDSLINDCNLKQESSVTFISLISDGDRLQRNEYTYADAMKKYNSALNLHVNDNLANQQINELNSKMTIAVAQIINRAKYLMAAGGYKEAYEILQNAQCMDPNNNTIQNLLGECNKKREKSY